MRANIDLTENRDFQKFKVGTEIGFNSDIRDSLIKRGFNIRSFVFPFSVEDYLSNNENLFNVGNREDLERAKFYKGFEDTCERCGFTFSKRPWHRVYGLCKDCDDGLEEEFSRDDIYLRNLYK